jgi:hypothetical protein
LMDVFLNGFLTYLEKTPQLLQRSAKSPAPSPTCQTRQLAPTGGLR